jgi:hypothetical protein
MKRSVFSATLILAVVAVSFVAASASAGEERPFKATVTAYASFRDDDGILHSFATGKATHLGYVDVVALVALNPEQGTATGTVTLTASNGDSVTLVFAQVLDPVQGTYSGDYQITGGTGRFEGATGSGTATKALATAVGEYEGTITF